MLLTVLGCSGSFPGPDNPASGYLVTDGETRLAVDFGNGVLGALQAAADPFELDALLLSHLHPDHCADFSALTVFRRYHPKPSRDPRAHRLPVHAPADAPSRLAAQYAPNAAELAETDLTDVYAFHPWGAPVAFGGIEVRTAGVAHPCAAYGLRLTAGGRSLCYTGDSGACATLDELADGADLLLAEASWTHQDDRPADLHLSGREAGELAARAGVGRLVLTHVPPWTDPRAVLAEAAAVYTGEIELARPAAEYTV
jgi:ribonuclease BN (tRNA processing enzyme)